MTTAPVQQALVILFIIGMFLTRPFRMGIDFTSLGITLMLLSGLAMAALFGQRSILNNRLKLACIFGTYWWFIACHSYVLGAGSGTFAFTAFLTNTCAAVAAALFFSSISASEKFTRTLIWIVSALTISAVITFCMYLLGSPFRSLVWANLPVSDSFYAQSGDILFPFSIAYNYQYYGALQVPRMSFGVREVGITQAFIGWLSIAALYAYSFKPPVILLIVFLTAILFTQSTTMIVTVILFFAVYVRSVKMNLLLKAGLLIGAFVGAIYAIFVWLNDQTFGFASKVNTESLTDRTWAIEEGMQNFWRNPIGVGLYNAEGKHSGITLIAQLQEIGILGGLGFLVTLIAAHQLQKRIGGSLVAYLPILAAAVTTQPLLDAPGFMPLLFALVMPWGSSATSAPTLAQPPALALRPLPRA